jgi:phenylalanyl-tRNA synthetase beta chain
LSEKFGVLRPSLLPGLIDSVAYSRRRESADVRLFEVGAVFAPAAEGQHVGWALVGSRGEHWSGSAGDLGFPTRAGSPIWSRRHLASPPSSRPTIG